MQSEFASHIRTIVSKKKKRYQQQGFDLDLSYVTTRIIAMGFPADNFEALYRNYIDDVARFFETNHKNKYKIYNLCRERSFDVSKFGGKIERFPFDDHNPPAFTILTSCIENIGEFLARDPNNVVAINCKAGKGRTGVIVCCSMLYSKVSDNATVALREYGRCRTHNGKGVTIPSQIRYIFYYDHFLTYNLKYQSTPIYLRLIKFDVVPNINNAEIQFSIFQFDSLIKLHCSKTYKISKCDRVLIFHEMLTFPIYDDLRFEFVQKSILGSATSLCHCWLNTFFVVNQPSIQKIELDPKLSDQKYFFKSLDCCRPVQASESNHQASSSNKLLDHHQTRETVYKVTLTKQEIDKANKDLHCRIFPANFEISFLFSDSAPDSTQRLRNSGSCIKIGNSIFDSFRKSNNESMIPQLEAMWKSSSSKFYFVGD